MVACLRAMSSTPVAIVRSSPFLLLCAPPGDKAAPQAAGGVPLLTPAMPLLDVAATSVVSTKWPILVGVDDVDGELVVRMRGNSIGGAVFPTTMDALGCG